MQLVQPALSIEIAEWLWEQLRFQLAEVASNRASRATITIRPNWILDEFVLAFVRLGPMCGNGNFDFILLLNWCVLAGDRMQRNIGVVSWMNVKCLWIVCTIGLRRYSNATRNHFIMATTNRTDFYPLPSNANRAENNGDGKTIGKAN